MPDRGYHHGDLRRALIDEAVEVIVERGVTGWSMRELARRAGVSHAAPAYHFGDRQGLLTAIATEGFRLQTDELSRAGEAGFLEVGVAYVRFAVDHPAHFEVMYQPNLLKVDDPEFVAARLEARAQLYPGAAQTAGVRETDVSAGLAAWSLVHGLATLWLNDALPAQVGSDPDEVTRTLARHLFVSP